MALQASGAISLANIQTEFGGSNPISLSEYYRNGAYVGGGAPNVPTSGTIDFADFYGAQAAIILTISSNASNQNILTLATAAGYTAGTDTTPIIVNINSGVTVSGSGTYALRTGVLNASSSLTINISGSVDGFFGANGGVPAGSGAAGGDALYWETSGTSVVNVLSGGSLRGGGGGGGGGGQLGIRYNDWDGKECLAPMHYGAYGATGSTSFGANGGSGGTGTYSGGEPGCESQLVGGGGGGGTAGYALRKNSKTVTLNNSGTVAGSAA
jgi:hypothetical protein